MPSTLAVVAMVLLTGCGKKTEEEPPPPRLARLRYSSRPIDAREALTVVSKATGAHEVANQSFQRHLQQLTEFADEVRKGEKYPTIPDIFDPQFETSFIDRNQLQSAYLGERIRIARWGLTNQTPTYYESIAVRRLFRTLLEPWRTARDFRIDLRIYEVKHRPNYQQATLQVDIAGRVDARTVQSTGVSQEIGRSAVGRWRITWTVPGDDAEPRIKAIEMLDHEETINYIEGGTLFADCTKSVLRSDPSLQERLSFGLDQWANRIVGLDVTGNNGLALGDVNQDGLDDVYVCQPHGLRNLLLVQNPDGTADNLAIEAGVDFMDNTIAALIVDVDNDRRQDLIVATDTRLLLLSNTGNGSFQLEHSLRIGFGTSSLSAADYDQDGDLDLLLCKYRPASRFDDIFPQPRNSWMESINGGRNVLLRNNEAWEFEEVTASAGLDVNNNRYTSAALWLDFDVDGDLDLYLVNDFSQDSLFENRNGWFREIEKFQLAQDAARNSTASVGDFNHDGYPDLFVAADVGFTVHRITSDYIDLGGRHLKEAKGFGGRNRIYYRAVEEQEMQEFPMPAPLLDSESSFGSVAADFNNDSRDDIVVTNGWISRGEDDAAIPFYSQLFDESADFSMAARQTYQLQHEVSDLIRGGHSFHGHQRNRMFLSIDRLSFANYSDASGLDFLQDGRGVATTDWDGDGDVDLILANRNGPRLRILQNQYRSRNRYLKLRLQGTTSNRDAIGSRIEVFLPGAERPLVKTISAGSGRQSQSSKEVHFGLGRADRIEKIVVHWPDGVPQTIEDLEPDKTYLLVEGKSEAAERASDRLRIALDPEPLPIAEGLPKTHRVYFYPPARLPILQYRRFGSPQKQEWYQIENAGDRPLLCIFCPNDRDNVELIRDWSGLEREFEQTDSDLLIAFTGNFQDRDCLVTKSMGQIQQADYDMRWGVLSKSSNAKLAQLFGQWFFQRQSPKEPFGILMDGSGDIHFGYSLEALSDPEKRTQIVIGDLRQMADAGVLADDASPLAQAHWADQRRFARFDRLITRFQEMGYRRDAESFEEFANRQQARDYLYRAVDLASSGMVKAALAAAEKSQELDPDSVEGAIVLADILRQSSLVADSQARTRMLRRAGEVLDQALHLEPDNLEAILARADVFRLQKDIENALNLLINYLKLDPECWQVHAIVGRLFFHKREYYEAAEYLSTAIENRPTLPYVAGDLGLLYLLNDQYGDAAEFLQLATRLQPSDPNFKRLLAEAEFWKGNFDVAGKLFERVVETEPGLSHSKQMLAWLKACSPYESFRDGEVGLKIIAPFTDDLGELSAVSLEIKAACLAELNDFDQAMQVQQQAIETIESRKTMEKYSPRQLAALKDRLELYKRGRPYRLNDTKDAPLNPLGRK